MGQFKAIVTVTLEFDSVDEKDAVNCAKTQIDSIMQVKPFGGDFNSFCLQVDVAKMKDRKKMIHLGVFEPNDVFPHICCDESKREYVVGDKAYMRKDIIWLKNP